MVESVASKRVLAPHPAVGIIGVGVFFVTVFVYLRIPLWNVFLKLDCLSICDSTS
jgi:hypothetical protein